MVAVHDLGGSGPPVLLAHATGFHGRIWSPVASHLGDRFHPIAYDARGHGRSGLPPGLDFDWHGLARDVLAVVERCRLTRPVAMGHSSGGAALLLAEQDAPGTFAALYCFEPTVVAADPPLGRDPDNWMALAARRRREVFSSRDAAYHNYASKPPFSSVDPATLRAYVDHGFEDLPDGSVRLRCRGEHEALVHEMASAHDAFAHLGEIACPVLLAVGERSEAVGPGATEGLARRLRLGRTEVLPGLTHFGPLEDPGAVARSAAAFFDSLDRPRADRRGDVLESGA